MSEQKFLFIRDDGRSAGDVFPQIEDFLRNVRAENSPETWASPITYRTPFRLHRFHWKLVRDLEARGTPQLFLIDKDAESYVKGNALKALDVEALLNAADQSYAGAVFFATYPVHSGMSPSEILEKATIAVKDKDGFLVCIKTGERLHGGRANETCLILFAVFKMGQLPIYTLFLNNDFVVNKVWFRDREEHSAISVFAENLGTDSIFSPMLSTGAQFIGNNLIYATRDFEIDFFGTKVWQGVLEKQESGSEIVLDGLVPPSLAEAFQIEGNVPYEVRGTKVLLRPPPGASFLKVRLKAGVFYEDFGFEQKWEWMVQTAYS